MTKFDYHKWITENKYGQLTEIYQLKKRLKKNPNNTTLSSRIKSLCSKTTMPKSKK